MNRLDSRRFDAWSICVRLHVPYVWNQDLITDEFEYITLTATYLTSDVSVIVFQILALHVTDVRFIFCHWLLEFCISFYGSWKQSQRRPKRCHRAGFNHPTNHNLEPHLFCQVGRLFIDIRQRSISFHHRRSKFIIMAR